MPILRKMSLANVVGDKDKRLGYEHVRKFLQLIVQLVYPYSYLQELGSLYLLTPMQPNLSSTTARVLCQRSQAAGLIW